MDEPSAQRDPIECIETARTYDVAAWQHRAYHALCDREQALNASEGRRLGWDETLAVCRIREQRGVTMGPRCPCTSREETIGANPSSLGVILEQLGDNQTRLREFDTLAAIVAEPVLAVVRPPFTSSADNSTSPGPTVPERHPTHYYSDYIEIKVHLRGAYWSDSSLTSLCRLPKSIIISQNVY